MSERSFGGTGTAVAPVAFGTMRLDRRGLDGHGVGRLVAAASAMGLRTLHSSAEYNSFPLLSDGLGRLSGASRGSLKHIVKLAEPHFDSCEFLPSRFSGAIDQYLRALHTDHLAVVQWMIRANLDDHPQRLAILERDAPLIADAVSEARKAGKLGAMIVFPYDHGDFRTLEHPWCDGLAVYVNPLELSYVDVLSDPRMTRRSAVAIRPYAGDAYVDAVRVVQRGVDMDASDESIRMLLLRFPLYHPAVATTVVGISSVEHAVAAARALDTRVDVELFHELSEAFVKGASGMEHSA